MIARVAPDVAAAAAPYLKVLTARIGARVRIEPDPARPREALEVAPA